MKSRIPLLGIAAVAFLFSSLRDPAVGDIARSAKAMGRDVQGVLNHMRKASRTHAQDMAVLHDVLLESIEKDESVNASVITRLSARVWAYRTAAMIPPGDSTADLSSFAGSPPAPAGWIDLTYLLTYLGEFELAEQALTRGATSLNPARRLELQLQLDEYMGWPVDTDAAGLIGEFNRNPDAVYQVYPDFNRRWCGVPFEANFNNCDRMAAIRRPRAATNSNESRTNPDMDDIRRRVSELDTALIHFNDFRMHAPTHDKWTADRTEGMPGQTIELASPRHFAHRRWTPTVWIEQAGKKYDYVTLRVEYSLHTETELAWTYTVFLPPDLRNGAAAIRVEDDVIPIQIVPRPAPPVIKYARTMVSPGMWTEIRVRQLIPTENSISPQDVEVQFNQRGTIRRLEWIAPHEAWGRPYEFRMVCRIPKEAEEGRAGLKVVQRGVESAAIDLCVVDGYFLRDGRAGFHLRSRKASPGERIEVTQIDPADDYKFLVMFNDGICHIWNPERAPDDPLHNGFWRVLESWPAGRIELRFACRQGDAWTVAPRVSAALEISDSAPAPPLGRVKFISRLQRIFDISANDTIEFQPGTLVITGPGIIQGEVYCVIVRWESSGEFKFEKPAGSRNTWYAELPAGSSRPDVARIAHVVNDHAGDFAERQVEAWDESGMGDEATPQGRAATLWLRKARDLIDSRRPPTLPELLQKMKLTRLPESPWGGPWTYVPTPGERSYTFLAFDTEGALRAQLNDGGPSSLFVDYDALRKDEPDGTEDFGATKDNLLWVYPWEEGGLGNVVADAARAAAEADIGVYNPTGLCGNFPKGAITSGIIEEALPYDNELVVLEMTGADLAAFFQEAAQPKRFLYVSGMQIKITPPVTSEDSPTVTLSGERGEPVAAQRQYRLAVNDYLLERANYAALSHAKSKKYTNIRIRSAVEQYIRKSSPLTRPDPRWK